MMTSNRFQAESFQTPTKHGQRTHRELSTYPTVPATYPNREVRRLALRRRVDLMPTPWRIWVAQTFPGQSRSH